MDRIAQLLEVKTRLTTIKGFAQLLDRDVARMRPPPARLSARIAELNHEITRLVDLIDAIEATLTNPAAELGRQGWEDPRSPLDEH